MTSAPKPQSGRLREPISLALLLRGPRAGWQQAVERAIQELTDSPLVSLPMDPAGIDERELHALLDRGEVGIHHAASQTGLLTPAGGIAAFLRTMPCFDNVDEILRDLDEDRLRAALTEHRAYLSLSAVPFDHPAALPTTNSLVCSIAAELWDEDVLAVHEQTTQMLVPAMPELRECLARGIWPVRPVEEVESVCEDCVAASAAQARARWPEFVDAFHARTSSHEFHVKHRLGPTAGPSELVWSLVDDLTEGQIRGTLASDPLDVSLGSPGDPQQIAIADVLDWLYVSGTPPMPHGWFSRPDPDRPHGAHR